MAKIPVGGSNGLIDRLITQVGFNVTANTADQERVDCLNALNWAEQELAQAEALKYLERRAALTLNSGASTVAVPAGVDFGKDIYIENSTGDGIIPILPARKFAAMSAPTYDRITQTPSGATIAADSGTDALTIYFKPANTSGGNLALTLVYQKIPAALTDSNVSNSLLPEGYEITLLLRLAEFYIKQRRNEIGWDALKRDIDGAVAAFYSKQRSGKLKSTTDEGLQREAADAALTKDQ
jgi:hypothetical protein